MLFLGCHLSTSKGFLHMGQEAVSIGAGTFQFFSRNPRGGSAKPIDEGDASALRELLAKNGFGPLIAHAPYVLNLASPKAETLAFGRQMLAEDLERLRFLPGQLYNFHPGSHVGQGTGQGIGQIVEALNDTLRPDLEVTVLLESMTGKGTEIGGRFEELRDIIAGVKLKDKVGVCLDTCHIFDAGYDIVNDLEGVLREFDRIVGLDKLKALHLNDSKNRLGDRKDRHANIGEGNIGLAAFGRIVNHPFLKTLPMCLETPSDLDGYAAEIRVLRALERDRSSQA